jgi:hypothetical protein
MAGEYAPSERPPGPDCTDRAAYGSPSALDQYITKQYLLAEEDYPADACPNRYYSTAKIDNWEVTTAMTGALSTMNIPSCTITCAHVTASGTVTANAFSGPTISALNSAISSKKSFDIPHPTKEGHRLRHICLEGPEAGVYFRGRVTNKKEIILPDYWKSLVDWTTITVNLTPIGSHQSVIVKRWDEEKIYLQSNGGMPIDCFFHVYGERSDGERLIVEYEGTSIDDYPGDNSQYTCNK